MPGQIKVTPPAFLKGLTPESVRALGEAVFRIPVFPFRIGRDSRRRELPLVPTRRRPDSLPINDLFLKERGASGHISREHLLIDYRNHQFLLEDRGSFYGILVEGVQVGGQKMGGQKVLSHGDVVIIGDAGSPFVFKFLTELPKERS